jgi:hypothetical protein
MRGFQRTARLARAEEDLADVMAVLLVASRDGEAAILEHPDACRVVLGDGDVERALGDLRDKLGEARVTTPRPQRPRPIQ